MGHHVVVLHAHFGLFCAKEGIMAGGYANFPLLCLVRVAMRRVCLGRLSYRSYSKLWQSLCPPHESGSRCKTTDCDAVYVFYVVLNAQRASCPGCEHTQRPQCGMSTYGAFFACLSHPLPKSKWHVPPPANGFCLWLLQPITSIAMPTKWVEALCTVWFTVISFWLPSCRSHIFRWMKTHSRH